MEIGSIMGITGLLLILTAFALNLFHKLKVTSKIYLLFNLVGSIFLAYYAIKLDSIPFLILQVVWTFFSGCKLISLMLK